MGEKLNEWISNNPWIKESQTYKTGEYLKYKPKTVPKLNKLTSKKINTFINFWEFNI